MQPLASHGMAWHGIADGWRMGRGACVRACVPFCGRECASFSWPDGHFPESDSHPAKEKQGGRPKRLARGKRRKKTKKWMMRRCMTRGDGRQNWPVRAAGIREGRPTSKSLVCFLAFFFSSSSSCAGLSSRRGASHLRPGSRTHAARL